MPITQICAWRKLLPTVRALLRNHTAVVGVGLGVRPDRLTDQPVWRIYVSSPCGGDQASLSPKLPGMIFGLSTQVHRMQPGHATSGAVKVYTAGMQIETFVPDVSNRDPQGALGCFALDSNQKPVLLSCSHVLFPGFHAIPGLAVYQPSYSSCCSGGDNIATPVFDATQIKDGLYKGGFKTQLGSVQVPAPNAAGYTTLPNQTCTETDCAIASVNLDPNTRFRNVWTTSAGEVSIGGVNTDILSLPFTPAGTAPQDQSYVRIFSPVTNRLIYGTLMWFKTFDGDPDGMSIGGTTLTPLYKSGISESPTDDESAGTMPCLNQFLILPRPAPIAGQSDYTQFYNQPNQQLSFNPGDSGSIVIDYQGRVIAQIVRKLQLRVNQYVKDPAQQSLIEFTSVGNFGVASPIQGVLDQLSITIPANFDQSGPTGGAALGAFPAAQLNPERMAEQRTVARLRGALLASRRGRLLIGKIGLHRREIRSLLVRVRAVASAWRQMEGAAFYYEAVRNARDPSHSIPVAINGVKREQLVDTMTQLMMHYGSPELRLALSRHRGWATPMLLQVSTLDDVPELLARRKATL
jgi:hypothetical protein